MGDTGDVMTSLPQMNGKSRGHPVPIVIASQVNGRQMFDLDLPALESILLSDAIRHKRVAVLSVAGAFRRGKSFLLDFFLRYLERTPQMDEDLSWLGDPDTPLTGFPWRGGAERETTGILMWSEGFLVKIPPKNEEIVVLIMDTQGAFDSQSTVKECATVFALSTMLSSIQVYNISNNIQEDNLQHLQLFTEYGRLAKEDGHNTDYPFQNLEFLVRDWSFPYEYEFGEGGGSKLLHNRLKVCESQHNEHQQLRRHITSCFRRIGCFLMPHPGLKVATNPHFNGRLADIEPEFVTQLKQLVPLLLAPKNLVVKEINGADVTCRELLEYFKAYIKMYQSDILPEPKSMLIATAEANNLAALAKAKDFYMKEMEKLCGGDQPFIAPELLETESHKHMKASLDQFKKCPKMGGETFSASYLTQLEEELAHQFVEYQSSNQSKNLLAGARTPLVILVCMVAIYVVAGVLDIVGLDSLAGLLGWVVWVVAGALAAWIYVSYTGEHRDIGAAIDNAFDMVLQKALLPAYSLLVQKGAQTAARAALPSSSSSHTRPQVKKSN